MSTSDNNLLNFLQKQSLFNNSPTKNVNRKMSSRSREKRSEQQWQGGANVNINANQNFGQPQNFNTNASFTVGQNGNSFTAGQNNANTFTSGQNNINTFSGGQVNNNQSFSTQQNFSAGTNTSIGQNFSQGQAFNSGFGVQANLQDNNAQLQIQPPSQFGSSFQSQQQYGNVKVETNIQSPTKQTVQTNFQNNNNFGGFNANLKLN